MKVMFDTSPGPFTPGGTQTYIQNLLHALQEVREEYNLDIFASYLPKWLWSTKTGLDHKLKVLGWDTLYMHVLLPKYAINLEVDVLHTPAYRLPLQISTCTVTTIHDVIPFIFPELFRLRDRLVIRAYMRLATKYAHSIITISEQSRQDIHRTLLVPLEKIHVTSLGVSPEFHRKDPREGLIALSKYGVREPFILSVGTIEPRKNLARVLQMFSYLKHRKRIPHSLVLTGRSGWLDGPIMHMIHELGIEGEVRFTGYVEKNDLPALYSAASLFVYPSIYEGFGLPPLEAMSCGCPVVTSDSSSIPEVVGKAAVRVDPSNLQDLCDAVMQVLGDENFAASISNKGMDHTSSYTWYHCAKQTINVYHHILNT